MIRFIPIVPALLYAQFCNADTNRRFYKQTPAIQAHGAAENLIE